MIGELSLPASSPLRSEPLDLRDIAFPAKDEPLRRDVGLLGDLVGQVIREQGGDALFKCVEAARHAAIRRREGRPDASEALEAALRSLDAQASLEVVRAFSTYFQVVNLAERVHRIRRGRERMVEGDGAQEDSLLYTVRRLQGIGLTGDQAVALFAASCVEPVFTAHPTESTRRAILDKQLRIAEELIARLDPSRTPREERVSFARIREAVTAAWQTEEHPFARPTVADEREHVLYYVSTVLYRVLPVLHDRLDEALAELGVEGPTPMPALVRPGSWVGGDMDGNPNVNATTLRDTLRRHREAALGAYLHDVSELARQLTQSDSRVGWSDRISELTERYSGWFPEEAAALPARHAGMGYRLLLRLIGARLEATLRDDPDGYGGPTSLLEDVEAIAESLQEHRGAHAGLFGVQRLAQRIRAFGFHMAALDVRQDARVLREIVAEILGDPEWPARSAATRSERLRELLREGDRVTIAHRARDAGARVAETLDVFAAISEARDRHGPDAIGSFIISMAEDVDDVLTVLWLATLGGLGPADGLLLDVAPLFETVSDLEGADRTLDRILADPMVARRLVQRGRRQTVVVGYSDSAKDGGIFSARWALHRALEGMADTATRRGVTLTIFHGRGGTVSRGGGSIHRAVAAMPARSVRGRLRLTEQGEVIDAKYGLPQIALRNLERMLGAIVLRAADPGGDAVPPRWLEMAHHMAQASRSAYRGLVYEDRRFVPYFRHGTPIDVIERMSIGSRPPSRRAGAGVEDLRAIPWVFSWSQCRAMMTGWYGLGTALEAARSAYGLEFLRETASTWPFFDTLLADVEMVLAKADLDIAAMYVPLVPSDAHPVFDALRAEFERTADAILEIRGSGALLDSDATLQRSIRLRNPYVDPMNVLQVDLLHRWRAEGRPEGRLQNALLATVNGIAQGLQNAG